ncbi:RRP15-like protein [Oratosquilla oratoria]|uniref:RRP15-like protein n=1 Tax=Oratosquilla oratoria TaxID=337810 RepID=UPI003F764C7A
MAVGVPTKARVVEECESDQSDLESEPGDDLEELPTLALNRSSGKEDNGEIQDNEENGRTKKAKRKKKQKKVEVEDESGSEADIESEDEDVMESDDENDESQAGLANVMARILATKKSDILCKAKKGKPVEKRESDDQDDFEVEENGVVKKIKKDKAKPVVSTQSAWERLKERKLWEEMSHVKPDIKLDKEKEKRLKVLATKGVVQLLGAIEKHNKALKRKLAEAQGVTQKEKVLERAGKDAFLDILKGEGDKVNRNAPKMEVKDEVKEEEDNIAKKPKWSVLADNFYKEPTLEGWDKQESDDD